MTPKDHAAKLNGPCAHQLDAAEGAFIVPTLRIRARDCDDCLREAFAECAREAAEDMRERCKDILVKRAVGHRLLIEQQLSAHQSAMAATEQARAVVLEKAANVIAALPPRPTDGENKDKTK